METNNAMADGHPAARIGVITAILLVLARWIGRCKVCGATLKIEGRVATATHGEVAVIAAEGVYTTRCIGDASLVLKRCACGKFCMLRKVTEGKKNSKHMCGSKCTSATGPNCDCRCKGANHGSNC